MLNFIRLMVITVGMAAAPSLAFAQNCDAVVDDQAHVISDPGRVTTAANSLGNQGATVRVRTFDSAGSGGLDKTIEQLRRDCPAWQGSDDKHWKTTMLVLAYTPDKHQIGAYYGSSLVSRLGKGKWDEMIKDRLVPQIQASAKGDKTAITTGMVATLNEMQGALARPSTGGATTINQAADYGGLWKVLGWLVGGLILIVLVAGSLWLVFRTRSDSAANEGAKAQARRARSQAISGINEITDDATLASARANIMAAPADKQAALTLKLNRVASLGNQALATLSTFDNASGANPNEGLTVAAYQSNQRRYEEIIATYVVPAKQLLAEIERGEVPEAPNAAPTPPPEPYRPPVAPTAPFTPGQPPVGGGHFIPDDQARDNSQRSHFLPDEAQRGSPRSYPPTGSVWPRSDDSPWRRPAPPPPQQPQVVERVVERDSGSDMLTGIVVGGLLSGSGRDRDRDEDRRERQRERDEERRERDEERRRERDEERRSEQVERQPVREPEPEQDSGGSFSVAVDKEEDSGGSFSADTSDGGGSISVDTGSGSDYGGSGSDTSSSSDNS